MAADRIGDGWVATHWQESACSVLRAVARGYAPSGTHPAKPEVAVAKNLVVSVPVVAIHGSVPLFPGFADAESHSNSIECPGASAIATNVSAQNWTACPTTECHGPSTFPRELRIVEMLLPVALGQAHPACCRWPPVQSDSGYDRLTPTAGPSVAAIPSAL